MRKIKIDLNSLMFFYIMFSSTGLFLISIPREGVQTSFLVNLLFSLIGIISILNLSFERNLLGYSINSMHWMFIFIFLFFAPVTQSVTNSYPWHLSVKNEELVFTNLIIIIWCIVYMISYKYFFAYHRAKGFKMKIHSTGNNIILVTCFIISSLIFVYTVTRIGFVNLLSRYTYTNTLYTLGGDIYFLIFNTFIRAFVLFSFALAIIFFRSRKNFINFIFLFLLGFYVVVLYFPAGSGRFWAFTIYIGILIQFVKKFKNRFTIKVITFFGLLYLLPLLNIFRYTSITEANLGITLNNNIVSSLVRGDFDAYSMILRTFKYLNTNSITYGRQLLGGLLFFIPRGMWSTKPIGSGALVGKYQGLSFFNISSPLIAEGMINFGIFGVFLYAIIFSFIVSKVDYISEQSLLKGNRTYFSTWELVYPYLVGFTFLLLRGDFMTSFSNLVGFFLPAFIIMKLIQVVESKSSNLFWKEQLFPKNF